MLTTTQGLEVVMVRDAVPIVFVLLPDLVWMSLLDCVTRMPTYWLREGRRYTAPFLEFVSSTSLCMNVEEYLGRL